CGERVVLRGAVMRCPRCTLAELPDGTETCVLCGYSSASVAVAEAPPPPPPPAQRLSPTELDARRELARDFRIDSLLEAPTGQIVYLARDSQDRPIALKVVPRTLAGAGAGRFDAAATGAAKLDHPHIVPIYGHGATDNFLWCATKHVEGRALGSILRGAGPISSQTSSTSSPHSEETPRGRTGGRLGSARTRGRLGGAGPS